MGLLHYGNNGVQFGFYVHRLKYAHGVSSLLLDGKHILMWDFDNVEEDIVVDTLLNVMVTFDLNPILVRQLRDSSYHAYCFSERDFADAFYIVSQTEYVDTRWLDTSWLRRKFVLRYAGKYAENHKANRVVIIGNATSDSFPFYLLQDAVGYWARV